jgi:hypothetical protein
MNNMYSQAAMGFTSDLTWGTWLARGWTVPNLVTYMESHDEERMMYRAVNYGNSNAGYNIKDTQTALKRMELSTVFFLTLPGPKMIWMFGELGYDISIDYNGRTGEKPILWNYYNYKPRQELFQVYKTLNYLRKTNETFSTSSYTYSLSGMQKSIQLNSSGMNADIIGNFDIVPADIDPAFQNKGKWYEYFTGDSITVSGVSDPINLKPGEYRIYTTIRLALPDGIVGIQDHNSDFSHGLAIVYPNPSDGEVYFKLSENQYGKFEISIVDITGNIIRQINSGTSSTGGEIIKWDGKTETGAVAKKGFYFARIKAGKNSEIKKIVID